ncbi:MAG: thioredoxin family protein [Tannerella sp.]|jgi:hypothetical protein|nr:thioredoxin family protein [Tannerella sp.]
MNIFKYKTIIRYVLCTFFICYAGSKAFANDENTIWYESKEEAFSAAKEQNKHVFLLLGNEKCSNCNIIKTYLNRPELKEIVDKGYILWYCDSKKSDEANSYDGMYPSAYIPLICIIDPNDPTSPLSHSRGLVSAKNLKTMLEDNQPTANENISDTTTTQAYISDNMLTLSNTFTDEVISIYTLNGLLIDLFPKKEYSITRVISSLPKGILLINSSEKWARKILN